MSKLKRETKETEILSTVRIGTGQARIKVGDQFLAHMVETLARYANLDIEIEATEILRIKEMLNRSMADMTGQTFERIEKDTDRDYFLSAKEAKEYGLIDKVISHPSEA